MEGLLILVGIYVLEIIIKKVTANKKNAQESQTSEDYESEESYNDSAPTPEQGQPKRNLQDLIRQFEEAQREASGGTLVPPEPPVEDIDEESDDLPVVTPAKPGEFTFNEIAESVVQWEYVSVELLQEAFGFSEHTAQIVLTDLQAKRIVGRDMGDGDCDLLVHDKVELENLFKQLQREAEEKQALADAELQARREAEAKRKQELADLEERARQAREQANATLDIAASAEATSENSTEEPAPREAKICTLGTTKEDIRRGFIWAKVLDEPRFKKRWSARVR